MKEFFRRLKYYGVGFGIGMIFVFFFFQNRGCTWFPSNRVKNTILGRVVVVPTDLLNELNKEGVSKKEIVQFLNEGDVDFGGSKKTGNPQVYAITKEIKGKDKTLWFTLPQNSFIAQVIQPKGSIQLVKNPTEGNAQMISFPNVKNIVYLDTNKVLTCQQEKLGLIAPMQFMVQLKKSGSIDFSKSDFNAKPLAIHKIDFKGKRNEEVGANVTWYQEHIRFDQLLLKDTSNCSSK